MLAAGCAPPCAARAAARRPRHRWRALSINGYAGKMHWSESDFQLVTIERRAGSLADASYALRHRHLFIRHKTPAADGRIRAIYVVRNPDKLRGFLEHTHRTP